MLKEIIIAIQSYFKAHALLRQRKNYTRLVFIGIVYAIIFSFTLYLFYQSSTSFTNIILQQTNIKSWLHSNNDFLTFLFAISVLMLHWVVLVYYFSLIQYMILIFCSPVFSYLSIKTNDLESENISKITVTDILKLSKRGSRVAIENLLWQSLFFIVFLVLSIVPFVGWVMPLIAIFTACYYYGFSMMDYSAYHKKLTIQLSSSFIKKFKGFALGNGIIFYTLHGIPILGWIVAPIYSTIAATISLQKKETIT